MLKTKRVYELQEKTDGLRILVDKLWPRGLTKEKARIDLWLKDVAPSDQLRRWFGHDPTKWEEFKRRYFKELKMKVDQVKLLKEKNKAGQITLLFGAKDEVFNNAVALKEYLEQDRL